MKYFFFFWIHLRAPQGKVPHVALSIQFTLLCFVTSNIGYSQFYFHRRGQHGVAREEEHCNCGLVMMPQQEMVIGHGPKMMFSWLWGLVRLVSSRVARTMSSIPNLLKLHARCSGAHLLFRVEAQLRSAHVSSGRIEMRARGQERRGGEVNAEDDEEYTLQHTSGSHQCGPSSNERREDRRKGRGKASWDGWHAEKREKKNTMNWTGFALPSVYGLSRLSLIYRRLSYIWGNMSKKKRRRRRGTMIKKRRAALTTWGMIPE